MKKKHFLFCLTFLLLHSILGFTFHGVPALSALELSDGRIKLDIDEKSGRFSLYYMTDVEKKTWEPLFWAKDKRTSFLSVDVGGKEYKLGETSAFKTFIRGTDKKPVLAYESEFLSVVEEFSFIRTASSGVSNGVRIDIRIQNWGEQKINVGARFLVDTFLGEKTNPPFKTDLRNIISETEINKTTNDQYWVSHGDKYGFMGSIFVEGTSAPDYLHFANWKRLSDARFEADYVATRNFNLMPFSAKDSAVCYYLNIEPLQRWGERSMTILLAAEDQYGFDYNKVRTQPTFEYYAQPNFADNSVKPKETDRDELLRQLQDMISNGKNNTPPPA
ncbi:MAG: hypothetical protein LBV52_04940, partial [Spirochaetaceae bacterium]|nr:hypothetical protein [Spirochaetaceae bacterium]